MRTAASAVDLEPAFILHTRPWQETSQILEVLGGRHGRVGLIARGSRRPSSKLRSVLQLFQPLRLSWSGRGSLYTLRHAEVATWEPPLTALSLMAAFYLNELLLCFVRRGDPHPALLGIYGDALAELRGGGDPEPALRRFELRLLDEIGYGLNLTNDAATGVGLDPVQVYEYRLEHGAVPATRESGQLVFAGADLLQMAEGRFTDARVLYSARRLMRAVLSHHLDGRTLRTREVLAAMRR